MNFLSFIFLGISLSMDAFAVSVSTGVTVPGIGRRGAATVGLYFGGFQAVMTLLGYLLGSTFSEYISSVDHWVAFGLLAVIGIKMIVDAAKKKELDKQSGTLPHKMLLTMSVATSIDALAVGISLALVHAAIGVGAAVIGIITFALCFIGVIFGKRLGMEFGRKATIIGGIVLILIGAKILVEHLMA